MMLIINFLLLRFENRIFLLVNANSNGGFEDFDITFKNLVEAAIAIKFLNNQSGLSINIIPETI